MPAWAADLQALVALKGLDSPSSDVDAEAEVRLILPNLSL